MKLLFLLPAAALMVASAHAEEPNIDPGMWETNSTVTLQSPQFSMPPRTETSSECLTQEKIAEGQTFLDDNEDCEFTRKEMRADGMDYQMTCRSPDGGTIEMDASLKFDGDTMSGTVDGVMESPMGQMDMTVEMTGKRTGDC
jgi:hypothetical protein